MNDQANLWPRMCDGCGNQQSMEFDHEHLSCFPDHQLTSYITFWQEVVEEERQQVKQNVHDEISRRKSSYALWVASRRLGSGQREKRRRSASDKFS